MSLKKMFVGVGLCLSLVSAPAFARQGARGQVRQQISEAVMTRIATALALDAATAERMRAIVAKHAASVQGAEQGQQAARKALRGLVASRSTDAGAYTKASDDLLAARKAHVAALEARGVELRTIFTPAQFAMLLLETPKIEHQVKQELLQAAGRQGDEE